METLNAERQSLTEQRRTLTLDFAKLAKRQQALDNREELEKKRGRNALDDILRDSRQQIRQVIQQLRDEATALTNNLSANQYKDRGLSTGDTGALKRQASDELNAISAHFDQATSTHESPVALERSVNEIAVGAAVHIDNLKLDGTVIAIHDTTVEVEAHGKRLHVEPEDLRSLATSVDSELGGITVDLASDDCPSFELNVVGCRVEEALSRVEKHVNQALLYEQQQLRIVHGYGTGRLRHAIRSFLQDHPLVSKLEPVNTKHGNNGVTIIELK